MVVEFINNEINQCDKGDDQLKTTWGEPCNSEWSSEKIIRYINKNIKLKTLNSISSDLL